MNGQSEPAPTSIPSKMEDMWTANAFSLYSCHTLNHGLTIHTHLPTYPPTYLPTYLLVTSCPTHLPMYMGITYIPYLLTYNKWILRTYTYNKHPSTYIGGSLLVVWGK